MVRNCWLPVLALGALCATTSTRAEGLPPLPEHPVTHIGGFTDFDFRATDEHAPGATSGFNDGQFVLHLASTLSGRFSFFGEISFTSHDNGYSSEIERTIIKYKAADVFGLSFGRYHTPINWWNTAYHHGQWLQTTVGRPEMVRFGGTFIPVHFVGSVAEGTEPMLGSDFHYEAGVGNGRADLLARAGDAGDANNNRAWFGTLSIRPDALYPLDVGGGFYHDLADLEDGSRYREAIAAAHIVWPGETPELLAEFAHVRHQDAASGVVYRNWAEYVQLAWRLPWCGARFKPYAREERLKISTGDPVFASVAPLTEYIAGLRYDAADFAALKAEFKRVDYERQPTVNALQLQLSCTF